MQVDLGLKCPYCGSGDVASTTLAPGCVNRAVCCSCCAGFFVELKVRAAVYKDEQVRFL